MTNMRVARREYKGFLRRLPVDKAVPSFRKWAREQERTGLLSEPVGKLAKVVRAS